MRTFETHCGDEITMTIKGAIADAKSKGDECQFDFKGVTVVVSGTSDPDLIYRDWSRGLAECQAEYAKKQAAQTATLQGALSVAGPIELADETTWNECKAKDSDSYGGRCVRYAEEWARLMQTRIANGETVAECAKELSRLADDDGITGFMYGVSVSILAKCWKHGEELRRWHNKETQIGSEGDAANESGGVLNPAVLNVR